jgi:hypothetical protein
MTQRTAGRLAWSLVALYCVLVVPGLVFLAGTPTLLHPEENLPVQVAFSLSLLVFTVVGALVASSQPRNPIGWLLVAMGMANALWTLVFGYTAHAVAHGGEPSVAAWLASLINLSEFGVVILLLELFPTGRPASPRWRWLVWITVVWAVASEAVRGLAAGPFEDFPTLDNPFGIEALRGVSLQFVGTILIAGALVSLAVRMRRAQGRERLQLKWFLFVTLLMVIFMAVGTIGGSAVQNSQQVASGLFFAVLLSGLPVAMGIAILRHDLYEIDVVINRTLVYGLLTATLAAVYVGSVLLLQLALGSVTSDSSLAVAASTLGVAALFRPARSRIQAAVDRRFYRRKYDAARMLEDFSAHLREEVDLEAVGAELRNVVHEAMQPRHVSLWLRSP